MHPASPPPPARPKARPDVVFRRVGEDWMVFDAGGQRLHVLNLSAALVWSHCTGELAEHEIAEAVAEAYGDPEAARSVPGTLEELRAAGLLEE